MTSGVEADRRLVLEAGGARLEVAPALGGRIASFAVNGRELLVTSGVDAIHWGSFPMVPFAGRVRGGTFTFRGRRYELERNLAPNAIHGTVLERRWEVEDERTIAIDLGPGWPFAGRVVQRFELRPGHLTVSLEIAADEPMPAALGWHPWFRRRLGGDATAGDRMAAARLSFEADVMLEREADGIAGRRRVAPSPGPWDDCFTELRSGPAIEWPGGPRLELSSSCRFWVVYDELPQAFCVEPQSAPPDDLNHDPEVIEPGRPLRGTMDWRWAGDQGSDPAA